MPTEHFTRTTLNSSSSSPPKRRNAEAEALVPSPRPLCPGCSSPLKKRYTNAQHGRTTGVQWECLNPKCGIIFVENPGARTPRIVRDAIISKPKKVRVEVPAWFVREMEQKIVACNPSLTIEQLIFASVAKGIPILERMKPEELVEVLSNHRRK